MRFGFAFGVFLLSTLPAFAVDAESKTPYVWRVVVQTPVHPALAGPARERLCKDLQAALQPALGAELGRVEVIDLRAVPEKKWEPLWVAFADGGWPAVETDEARKLTGIKTHFAKVEIRNGNTFRVEARQLDGSTGLVSAVVRSTETQNADTVARLAGLMIAKDFGPVGTVEPIPGDEKQVAVKFRGGHLPGFERTLQTGDVLAFALLVEPPRSKSGAKPEVATQLAGKPQSGTYLRVISKVANGECRCELLTPPPPAKHPLVAGKGVVGYRAMKVSTQEAKVQVRLLDKDGKPPPSTTALEIWATDGGFNFRPTNRDTLELQKGVYSGGHPLKNVACVVVKVGASKGYPFVVPLVPGREPITLRVTIDKGDIEKAEFEQACERLRGRVADAGAAQIELFKGLGKLITDRELGPALDRATKGAKATDTADQILSEELAKLKKDKLVKEPYPARLLAMSEDQLKMLRTGKPVIEKRMEELKEAIDKANDPVKFEKEFRANEIVRQIALHVGHGEVPEADALYDQLIELTKREDLTVKKAKLLADWAVTAEDHKKARAFLLEEWRKASTLAEYKALLPMLRPTADTLVKHADKLGLRNLLSAIELAYARLGDQLKLLDENTDADRATIKEMKALSDEVLRVKEAAQAELMKLEEKK